MEFFHNTLANLNRIVHLCARKRFRRILKANICVGIFLLFFFGKLVNKLCTLDSNINYAVHIGFENNFSLQG